MAENQAAEAPPVPQRALRARAIPRERLDEVERRILRAESSHDIERECSALWGTTRRNIRRYVAIVRRRLGDRVRDIAPEADGAQVRAMLEAAYRVANEDRDAKGMVAAARTLADVTGVAAPRKVDITTAGKPLTALSDEELDARIAALEAANAR